MRKSFFLKYASTSPIDDICKLLQDHLDMDFSLTPHDSSFVGAYYKYTGMLADKVTVEPNFVPAQDMHKLPDRPELVTIVEVSITSGRNADKASKASYLRSTFRQLPALEELSFQTIESND